MKIGARHHFSGVGTLEGMSTVAPPVRKQKPRKSGPGSGAGRPWLVIVKNDDHNTFDGVAFALARTIPGVTFDRGIEMANRIHKTGRRSSGPVSASGPSSTGSSSSGSGSPWRRSRRRPEPVAAVDPWQIQADPEWALAIIVAAVDYAVVVRTFERRGSPTPTWRRACFATGLALIAIGLLSPLEHIALTSLLSAHLLQNVILADWAPPLLVLGLTPAMMAAAERRRWVRAVTAPPVALALWLAAWYVLHVPAVYGYALEHRWALGLEHLAFLGSGLAFWWAVMSPGRMRAQAAPALPLRRVHRRRAGRASPLPSRSRCTTSTSTRRSSGGSRRSRISRSARIGMAIEQAAILFAACSIAFMQWLDEDDAPPRPVGFPT